VFQTYELFGIIFAYLCLLFGVAYLAERREARGQSIVSNPYVYALSIAVYCTSWTYFGSVGKAANSGLDFLTIYTGPTLMASLWWLVLRKIVRISKTYRITSISDFLGARYGNSLVVSAIVTIITVIGITPYLGLQIKSIISTLEVCSGNTIGSSFLGWMIALVLAGFAVMFGARRLDASERHGGMVFAVAFESVIKLCAFLMVGIFVTYFMFDGFSDIFRQIGNSEFWPLLSIEQNINLDYPQWFSLTFLSMMAIMFLPRQFQMMVVENSDERHINKAMWLFPLYLVAINLFVLPIALGGLLKGMSSSVADLFMLIIPLSEGNRILTLATFLGGFSAASAMIIVESIALSTMVLNSLVVPVLYRITETGRFPFVLLNIKRVIILGCVVAGFLFALLFGNFYSLVDMGLKSFEAVSLFAPPLLIGLYWKGGNWKGATAGLIGGFTVWLYTLLLPAIMRAGIVGQGGPLAGLFDSSLLNPTSLMGLTGLDKWSHSLFWSLSVNCLLYFGVSLATRSDEEDTRQALNFVERLSIESQSLGRPRNADDIENVLIQYMGEEEGKESFARILNRHNIHPDNPDDQDVEVLWAEAEKILSGSIGSSLATLILKDKALFTEQEKENLSRSLKDMMESLRLSRQELAEANRELYSLKDFTERIIESMPLGVVKINEQGTVHYWNRNMENLTGIPQPFARGQRIQSLLGDLHPRLRKTPFQTGEFLCGPGPLKITGPDSVLKASVSRFAGAEKGFVFVFEDVTEKRRLEQELSLASKHASLGRLTAGVSHEIGNPLASISSLVQELVALPMDSEGDCRFARSSLFAMNEHLERIARIVRRLGDFARTSSSEKTDTNISEVLERTVTLLKYDKRTRNIRINENFEKNIPPIRVNPDQLQQVFLNLMLNALDAMEQGGELTIQTRRKDHQVEITFADSGSGIEPSVMDRIFDPFFTTKPLGKGTGLGLSICYGIINDHNGTIHVRSKQGQGATFIIRLPCSSDGYHPEEPDAHDRPDPH